MGKKIGIVTLYHENYNFGGLLQAYALPKALMDSFGVSAEQIDYVPAKRKRAKQRRPANGLWENVYQLVYRWGIVFFALVNKRNLSRRKSIFDRFMDEIPHSGRAYDFDALMTDPGVYDILICGGDQIWNDYGEDKNLRVYSLQFSSCTKKIAYAPSMAILAHSDAYDTIMRRGFEAMDAISVREKRSKACLAPLTSKQIQLVVDPVLLLTKNDWDSFAATRKKGGQYILCYLLGDSMEHRKAAEKLAKKLRFPILTFPHISGNVVRKCDLVFGDIRDYSSGPREFVSLIRDAEFVITDSFHACVFSMIFQTPFAVFERHEADGREDMNSRIYDFLEEYHLERQLATDGELINMDRIPAVDYRYAHAHWKQRAEASLEYLRLALEGSKIGETQ